MTRRRRRAPLIDRVEQHPVVSWLKIELLFSDPRATEPIRARFLEHPFIHTTQVLWREWKLRLLEDIAEIAPFYEQAVRNWRLVLIIQLADPPAAVVLGSPDLATTIMRSCRIRA